MVIKLKYGVFLVPRITKQIVSKSISTMEEMSQRMNTSQNVTVNQVPEKVGLFFRSDHFVHWNLV